LARDLADASFSRGKPLVRQIRKILDARFLQYNGEALHSFGFQDT
jgi:hypothetical protein